ncbi:MAG: N-6 DNA methylase [Defluviitaleaceae bacterium]|nr:N-6 DNA methylase [Defluviitaleaceae bacterium]
MSYLEKAIKDGYAHIMGAEGKRQITYVFSNNHKERYENPEEKVRAEVWAELIYHYEYPVNRIKIEVTIPDRLPTDRADIVVFHDDACKRPYAVVECKKDGVSDAEFNQAIEQGVGNATWIKLRAEYVLIVAGATRRVLDVSDTYGALERDLNILADLPKAYGKPQVFRFYKGDKINDIQPVTNGTLIVAINKCHQTLWGGGKLSPPTAFGELCKLIFVKISDEKKPRKKGEPYEFQIKTHEPPTKLADRINKLYEQQKTRDPEVFTDSIKVDAHILRNVVSHLESINLNKTDLNVKGVAFERFMDSFFKGNFGQYFTPRPIIEFTINMLQLDHNDFVLDTSCGSGGFLLYAMNYIREQAEEFFHDDPQGSYKYWHEFAEKRLFGIEINDEIARVAKMNMIVHDDGHTHVICFDALDSIGKMKAYDKNFRKDRFDLVLTNPPFGAQVNATERPYLSTFILGNTYDKNGKAKVRKNQNTEVLFIERIWEFLKPGTGRAAIILPDGILANGSMQYVRDFILEKFQLLALVGLPPVAFTHFGAGVKASVLFVRKRDDMEMPGDDEVIFMATPSEIGYDATGRENNHSQLPEVVQRFKQFQNNMLICTNPNASGLNVFSLKRNEIGKRLDVYANQPKFTQYFQTVRKKFITYKLVDISKNIFSGITPKAGGDAYTDATTGIPFIRSGNINVDGSISNADIWIKPEIHNKIMKNSHIKYNDLLIAIVGATIGRVGLYKSGEQANINQAIAVVRIEDERFMPEYILYYLQSPAGQIFLDYLKRPVARANINLEEIGSIEVPLIPLHAQARMVSDISAAAAQRSAKLREAEEEWVAARNRFEAEILQMAK